MAPAILIKEPPTGRSKCNLGQFGMTTIALWKPVTKAEFELDRSRKLVSAKEWLAFIENRALEGTHVPDLIDPHIYRVIHNNTYPNGQLHRLSVARAPQHNDIKNLMLYKEVNYMTYNVTSSPFSYIYFHGPDSAVAVANGAITQNATESHFSAVATYTETVGDSVTEVSLCNSNATPSTSNEYADYTDASFPQAMAIGETMEVTWTHTWTAAGYVYSHATNINLVWVMAANFHDAVSTLRSFVDRSWIIDSGSYETNYVSVFPQYSGGGATDTSTTWRGVHTQSAGTYTVDEVYLNSSSYSTAYSDFPRYYARTGLSQAWASGATLTYEYIITWTET